MPQAQQMKEHSVLSVMSRSLGRRQGVRTLGSLLELAENPLEVHSGVWNVLVPSQYMIKVFMSLLAACVGSEGLVLACGAHSRTLAPLTLAISAGFHLTNALRFSLILMQS